MISILQEALITIEKDIAHNALKDAKDFLAVSKYLSSTSYN